MLGYILIDNKEKMKYQIGKRYRFYSENGFIYYNRQFNDVCHNFENCNCDKIYKIKIYDYNNGSETRDFKILHEINYKNLLNLKNEHEQFVSAIKNKEESVLDGFIKSNSYRGVKTIIKSKVYKYINKVVASTTKDKKIIHYITYYIKELGRNKYLDYFINCDNDIIKSQIADIGRPKDLNVLVNDENFSSMYSVLLNGRKKRH